MASKGLNKVMLIGNIGKDPEMRDLPSGGSVANLTLATSKSWNDKNTGEKKEKTEWHQLSFFGKLAEIVGQYVVKGSKIYVSGELETRKYQAQDGSDRYSTSIICNEMQMLDKKGDVDSSQGGGFDQGKPSRADMATTANTQAVESKEAAFDDDIPF